MDIKEYLKSRVPLDNRFGRYLKEMQALHKLENASPKAIIRDYIAGMTDGYAVKCMEEISIPKKITFDIYTDK